MVPFPRIRLTGEKSSSRALGPQELSSVRKASNPEDQDAAISPCR